MNFKFKNIFLFLNNICTLRKKLKIIKILIQSWTEFLFYVINYKIIKIIKKMFSFEKL